ncbi:MAG: ABC transporter substrate-binding protein [Eubacteriales bacterium]|nr:ABC transporter substrate-binding protein [Eubacteriales bacterium]
MKLKHLAAGMAAAMLLTACGSSAQTATTAAQAESTEASAEETTAAETAAEETEAAAAASGEPVKIVCTSEDYVKLFDKFTAETGIPTELLSMSSGEVLTKIKAEGGTPMADLWFGGGIDAFMGAKDDGLLEQVNFDGADALAPEYKDEENYWFAKGITVVGFLVNNDIIDEAGLTVPQSWDDLTDPSYKGEILMSNPAISGTNYAVVNAILQTKGDEDGWAYFEALNQNIDYYSKRGKDPKVKTMAGEVAIGIVPMDKEVDNMHEEQNVTAVYPSDGIPYVPEGVAVFKNGSNSEGAKQFIEWFYNNDENLQLVAEIDNKDTVKMIKPSMEGLELTFDTSKLMKEDLSLFGANRDDILAKWEVLAGDKSEE